MIVISGALLVVAVVFLAIGLYGSLAWVYASIVVSALAFVFILIALRQQRSAARDEPAAPANPLGLANRPTPDADTGADRSDSEVTLVAAPATVTSESAQTPDIAAGPPPTEDPTRVVPPPTSSGAGESAASSPDVPLVPATGKSAATKASKPRAGKPAAGKRSAKTAAAGTDPPAGEVTAAKKPAARTAAKKPAADAGGPASDAAPRKTAARKTARKAAASKPAVTDTEQPVQVTGTDDEDPGQRPDG